jgi:hypothetical protein
MYTVTIHHTKYTETLTDLPLERALVYKRRYARRGCDVSLTRQDIPDSCINGACEVTWRTERGK